MQGRKLRGGFMSFGRYVIFAVAMALLAGVLMAIQGATTNNNAGSGAVEVRWTGATAGSNATQGGNITNANITGAVQLTTKWADFYGNISGNTIALRDAAGNYVYTWAYSTAAGKGEICLSTASTFPPGTLAPLSLLPFQVTVFRPRVVPALPPARLMVRTAVAPERILMVTPEEAGSLRI